VFKKLANRNRQKREQKKIEIRKKKKQPAGRNLAGGVVRGEKKLKNGFPLREKALPLRGGGEKTQIIIGGEGKNYHYKEIRKSSVKGKQSRKRKEKNKTRKTS